MSAMHKFADPKFIGTHTILTETCEITRDSASGHLLNFRAYERCGMTVYKDNGPPYPPAELLEPIHVQEALKVGQKLLVPHPFSGGYNRITVTDVGADGATAEGDRLSAHLSFDQGSPDVGIEPAWVAMFLGCTKGLERIDFQ